jgi:hypothetical protein
MSITISNCDEICKSPTNNSPSKMLYTFPKTTRFHTRNAPMYFLNHLAVISTTIFLLQSTHVELLLKDLDINMILRKSK